MASGRADAITDGEDHAEVVVFEPTLDASIACCANL